MWNHVSRLVIGLGIVGIMAYGTYLIFQLRFPDESTSPSIVSKIETPLAPITPADRAVQRAKGVIARKVDSLSGYAQLSEAFMSKARETGDATYYAKAETAIQHVLTENPTHYVAKRVQAWIALEKHEFAEALTQAAKLQEERPNDFWVYGLLGDAYTELGEYAQAVETFQHMVNLRPGLPAYSRAAYMRTLHGDLEGATELMRMAVQGGVRRDPEPLAWALVQLGNLHVQQGQFESASLAYQQALQVFPEYYMALGGIGKLYAGQGEFIKAIQSFERAIAAVPVPEMVGFLGDLYLVSGKEQEAERQYQLVEFLEHINSQNGKLYSRQFALFYADHQRNVDNAIQLAEWEYGRRQDIYTQDTLAWVYYRTGRFMEASQIMEQALRLNTQDPLLFFHAGMIANSVGNTEKARTFLTQAFKFIPYFSPKIAEELKAQLRELPLPTTPTKDHHGPHKGETHA